MIEMNIRDNNRKFVTFLILKFSLSFYSYDVLIVVMETENSHSGFENNLL
ncbi:hypothetical protein PGB90_003253 [Kerria lacca]